MCFIFCEFSQKKHNFMLSMYNSRKFRIAKFLYLYAISCQFLIYPKKHAKLQKIHEKIEKKIKIFIWKIPVSEVTTQNSLLVQRTFLASYRYFFQLVNIERFSTSFRLDRNNNDGDIILYNCSYIIASKLTIFTFPNDIYFLVEINLKGNKWLICCSYNANRTFCIESFGRYW